MTQTSGAPSTDYHVHTRNPDETLSPARWVTVYKLDEEGRVVWHYPARVLAYDETSIRLEAFFDRPRVDLGPVALEEGDRFIETFYSERWYNVFAVYGRKKGRFKGWYCNICRPAKIGEKDVRCEDLALDVWVDARGEITLLDEDAFATLRISTIEREQAKDALREVLQMASERSLPA